MQVIYLDHNATTKPADEVVAAMNEALRDGWANPSSVHRTGQAVRRQVELARESVSKLIGCRDRDVVFTSGGTEAANLAICGSLAAQPQRRVLVTSRLEHSTVRELAEVLQERGTEVVWLPNDQRGLIDVDALRSVLARRGEEVALVSIMWANNETGVIQPIEQIAGMCCEHGVRFHTDATQWVGKMPTDVSSMAVDLLSFSAHKMHGPKGVGALYVRSGVRIAAQLIGGPQEREHRGGTENVPGIIGFGVAAKLGRQWLATSQHQGVADLRDSFERRVLDRVSEASIIGREAPRLWTTANIAFAHLEAEAILLMLSERGVCASAGAACSSGSVEPSSVLLAMNVPSQLVQGSVRFSLSRETTEAELEQARGIIASVIGKLRATMAGV